MFDYLFDPTLQSNGVSHANSGEREITLPHNKGTNPKKSDTGHAWSHQEFTAETRSAEFSPEIAKTQLALTERGLELQFESVLLPSPDDSVFRVRIKQPLTLILRI